MKVNQESLDIREASEVTGVLWVLHHVSRPHSQWCCPTRSLFVVWASAPLHIVKMGKWKEQIAAQTPSLKLEAAMLVGCVWM